ncbi:MAG: thioredoxin-dependent thiol peroxidase [Candidatus Omnitrophica bacterium]|nr:thioredoxin-dependent thiol peroxidase [Candidatus Omnitrophota bacterium]
MPVPSEGTMAPDFSLPASNGETVHLKDLKGQNAVLYFYPKDDTPGCTVEACAFRDSHKNFDKYNTVVFGISPDNLKSHGKFISKFDLPFTLLADENKQMAQDYGVWVEKSMYGKKYMGVARTTFVIDSTGKIAKVFEKVKPEGHDKEVLEVLKAL